MSDLLKYNLQFFADGGEGDGGASEDGESGVEIPNSVPERARANYAKAVKANSKPVAKEDVAEPTKMSYADMIKSDDYKDEHKAYMEKTINDRLKKYKGVEENNAKMLSVLQTVSNKYGIDASSESFLDDLTKKIDEDDSYYENYAVEHDITPQEARKIVTMERKVAQMESAKATAEREEQERQAIMTLRQNAEITKSKFPDFDLDVCMQDERFRRLCAVTNGDTTSAYMATNWDRIIPRTVAMATEQAKTQTANTIRAGHGRPTEAGLSTGASTVITTDFSQMNLQQLRDQARAWRNKR